MASELSHVGHEPQCGHGSTRDAIRAYVERLLPDLRLDEPVGTSPKWKVRIVVNGPATPENLEIRDTSRLENALAKHGHHRSAERHDDADESKWRRFKTCYPDRAILWALGSRND